MFFGRIGKAYSTFNLLLQFFAESLVLDQDMSRAGKCHVLKLLVSLRIGENRTGEV